MVKFIREKWSNLLDNQYFIPECMFGTIKLNTNKGNLKKIWKVNRLFGGVFYWDEGLG